MRRSDPAHRGAVVLLRPPRLEVWSPPLCSAHRLPLGLRSPSGRSRLLGADGASWRPPGSRGGSDRGPPASAGLGLTAGQESAALTVGRAAGARGRGSCGRRTRRRLRGRYSGATARSRQRRRLSARGPRPGLQGAGGGAGLLAPPRRSGLASPPPPPPRPSPPAPAPLGAPGAVHVPLVPARGSQGEGGSRLPINPHVGNEARSRPALHHDPFSGTRADRSRRNRTGCGARNRLFWKGCVVISKSPSSQCAPPPSLGRPGRGDSASAVPTALLQGTARTRVCVLQKVSSRSATQQSSSPKGRPAPRPTSSHLPGYPDGGSPHAVPSPSLVPLYCAMLTWSP